MLLTKSFIFPQYWHFLWAEGVAPSCFRCFISVAAQLQAYTSTTYVPDELLLYLMWYREEPVAQCLNDRISEHVCSNITSVPTEQAISSLQ